MARSRHHSAILKAYQVCKIRFSLEKNESFIRELARRYEVALNTIRNIAKERTWVWVD